MKSRSVRRHHYYRLKEKRIKEKYWFIGHDNDPIDDRVVGLCINTPAPCSNPNCCGNPRHGWDRGKGNMQERKQELKADYSYKEYDENE